MRSLVLLSLVVSAHGFWAKAKEAEDEVDRMGQMRVRPVGAYVTRCRVLEKADTCTHLSDAPPADSLAVL